MCRCKLKAFFAAYVRGRKPIPFDQYLRLIGMHSEVSWAPARNDSGAERPDLRIMAWMPPEAKHPSLVLFTPEGIWGKAGLHTGDQVLRVDGAPIVDAAAFRAALGRFAIGQPAQLAIERDGKTIGIRVVIRGYDAPGVTIVPNAHSTADQRALRTAWLSGGQ